MVILTMRGLIAHSVSVLLIEQGVSFSEHLTFNHSKDVIVEAVLHSQIMFERK